jgi:hypothetical protein
MSDEDLMQLVEAIEELIISVVGGEEFIVMSKTEVDCRTVTIVIPKEE